MEPNKWPFLWRPLGQLSPDIAPIHYFWRQVRMTSWSILEQFLEVRFPLSVQWFWSDARNLKNICPHNHSSLVHLELWFPHSPLSQYSQGSNTDRQTSKPSSTRIQQHLVRTMRLGPQFHSFLDRTKWTYVLNGITFPKIGLMRLQSDIKVVSLFWTEIFSLSKNRFEQLNIQSIPTSLSIRRNDIWMLSTKLETVFIRSFLGSLSFA